LTKDRRFACGSPPQLKEEHVYQASRQQYRNRAELLLARIYPSRLAEQQLGPWPDGGNAGVQGRSHQAVIEQQREGPVATRNSSAA